LKHESRRADREEVVQRQDSMPIQANKMEHENNINKQILI